MVDQRTEPIVDVYLRAFQPTHDSVDHVFETLERLADRGRIAGYNVESWPSRATLTDEELPVVATFERFENWADEKGVSIRPAFDVHRHQCGFTGDESEVLITPSICLAVRDEDELQGVYPCSEDGTVCTVDDLLASLERGTGLPLHREANSRAIQEVVQ